MPIFNDLETADLDPDFGQILQIGAITSGDDFIPAKVESLRARLLPWVVPAPSALLTTGITAEQLYDPNALTLFELARRFTDIVRQEPWPLVSGGYNNMEFDEDGIAAALHQNLLPYDLMTQRKDENSPRNRRFDVLTLVQACMIYKPGFLKLAEKTAAGNLTTKLGAVCRQNGINLSEKDAHEAVGDVKATMGLADLIRDGAPAIWAQMMQMTTQEDVQAFLESHDVFSYGRVNFGRANVKLSSAISVSGANEKRYFIFDLCFDPGKYIDKSVDELIKILNGKNSPFIEVRMHRFPILMPLSQTSPSYHPKGFDAEKLKKRAEIIRNNPDFQARLTTASALRYLNADQKLKPIEKQLRSDIPDEFISVLTAWKAEFHTTDWPGRAKLMRGFPERFAEELKQAPYMIRYQEFARRIIYDNAPEQMTLSERATFQAWIYSRIMDPNPHKDMMTIPKAREELAKIRKEVAAGKSRLVAKGEEHRLDALDAFYNTLEERHRPPLISAPQSHPRPGPA